MPCAKNVQSNQSRCNVISLFCALSCKNSMTECASVCKRLPRWELNISWSQVQILSSRPCKTAGQALKVSDLFCCVCKTCATFAAQMQKAPPAEAESAFRELHLFAGLRHKKRRFSRVFVLKNGDSRGFFTRKR